MNLKLSFNCIQEQIITYTSRTRNLPIQFRKRCEIVDFMLQRQRKSFCWSLVLLLLLIQTLIVVWKKRKQKKNTQTLLFVSIFDPIPQNQFLFFKDDSKKKKSSNLQVKGLKSDLQLVTKLLIANQSRSGELDEFFKYENQSFPPALSTKNWSKIRYFEMSRKMFCCE